MNILDHWKLFLYGCYENGFMFAQHHSNLMVCFCHVSESVGCWIWTIDFFWKHSPVLFQLGKENVQQELWSFLQSNRRKRILETQKSIKIPNCSPCAAHFSWTHYSTTKESNSLPMWFISLRCLTCLQSRCERISMEILYLSFTFTI